MYSKTLKSLNKMHAQCCYGQLDPERCDITSKTDPLLWYVPGKLGRYCSKHGPQTKNAKLKKI